MATSWGDGNDPFGRAGSPFAAQQATRSAAKSNVAAAAAASDPFAAAPRGPSADAFGGKTIAKVGNADPFASPAAGVASSSKKKGGRHLTDFLTGSPLRGPSSSAEHTPAKEKKKHKWVPKLTSGGGGSTKLHSSTSTKHQQKSAASNLEEVRLQMASEASRRAEDERRRRLELQEEQDLAYAIALSKAEAASVRDRSGAPTSHATST